MDLSIENLSESEDDYKDEMVDVRKETKRNPRTRHQEDTTIAARLVTRESRSCSGDDTGKQVSSIPRYPLVCLGYSGARHLEPVRLLSERQKSVVSLRIVEYGDDTVEQITRFAQSLLRLDLTHLRLLIVPDEMVSKLHHLQRLDLSFNELTEDSFPEAFQQLTSLIDLAVHYNKIVTFPKVWRSLTDLTRLKFGHNMFTNVDGIGKLKKLEILIMEHNQIETLPNMFHSRLKKVEILHLGNNCLDSLSSTIQDMRNLRDIDISCNKLTTLPVEVFMLPHIDVLDAHGNLICRIGVIPSRRHGKSSLSSVDLSDNLLVKFPESLLMLTDNLDLARNKIKIVSNAVLKKLDWNTAQQLFLSGNPLMFPPQDVCESGIRSIVHFFQEAKSSVKVYQGIKVALLGQSGSGKTSLVQTLVEQQSRLTEEYNGEQQRCGVDIHEFVVDGDRDDPLAKALQLSLWNFSGSAQSILPNQICIQPPMLILLTFNMADYDANKFDVSLGSWIDWCIAITNRLVLLPVGTHADRLTSVQQTAVCQSVYGQITAHIEKHKSSIHQEIKKIDGRTHISAAMSEQLKSLIALLRIKTVLHDRVVAVSSKTLNGIEQLLIAIKFMATDKESFPNVMRQIPTMWGDVENYIDDRGYSMPVPMLTWNELKEELRTKFGMRNLTQMIMQYLHDIGRVFWFYEHSSLKAHVVLRPSWLTEMLKALFHRNWPNASDRLDENRRQCGVSVERFIELRRIAADDGVVEPDFLKCIWAHILPPKLADTWMAQIQNIFVQHLQLAYFYNDKPALSKPVLVKPEPTPLGKNTNLSCQHSQRMLVPWLRETKQPRECREQHTTRCAPGSPRLAVVYRFPRYTPPGLFETLTVRTQNQSLGLTPLYHWKGGMCVTFPSRKPVLLYLLRIHHHGDGSSCLRVEVCYQDNNPGDKDIDNLWAVLWPFLEETESLLTSFKALRVDRHVECPACRALSFTGEWMTPREMQNLPPGTTKSCDVCKEAINVAYIIQPKERRSLENLISRKMENDLNIEEEPDIAAEQVTSEDD